jgi:hypothetical protein
MGQEMVRKVVTEGNFSKTDSMHGRKLRKQGADFLEGKLRKKSRRWVWYF